MSKILKTLKPLKQILDEYGYDETPIGIDINTGHICEDMHKFFGTEIEVEPIDDTEYDYISYERYETYSGKVRFMKWWWCEEWFDNDFIKEDDFTL